MAFKDAAERAESIAIDAKTIICLLKRYDGRDRIFALTEMVRICQRDLARRESSEYSINFSSDDEQPTNPEYNPVDIGQRKTRRVNIDELLKEERKKR